MADETTTTSELLDPEILAPMVQNTTQSAMVFMPLADIDRTLESHEGDTLKVPTWTDKFEASEVKEGQAIPVSKMTQSYTKATVKKFGLGVSFTDESDIERFGNNVDHATSQIGNAIAQAADTYLMNEALKVKNTLSTTADVDGIDAMESYFNTDVKDAAFTLICSPKTQLVINKSVREYTKGSDVGAQIALSGAVPTALGASIYRTKKMPDDKIIVVFSSAEDIENAKKLDQALKDGTADEKELESLNSGRPFKWLVKRDILIEPDRDKKKQINYIYGTQIAAPYIQNPSKLLVVSLSGGAGDTGKDDQSKDQEAKDQQK